MESDNILASYYVRYICHWTRYSDGTIHIYNQSALSKMAQIAIEQMNRKLVLDTDEILYCTMCEGEILPNEPKVIFGDKLLNGKKVLTICHIYCA